MMTRTVTMRALRSFEPGQLVTSEDVAPLPPRGSITELLEAFVDAAARQFKELCRGMAKGMGPTQFRLAVEPGPAPPSGSNWIWSGERPVKALDVFAMWMFANTVYDFTIRVDFFPGARRSSPRIPIQPISFGGGYVSWHLSAAFAPRDEAGEWTYFIKGSARLGVDGFVRIGRSDEPVPSTINSLRIEWIKAPC